MWSKLIAFFMSIVAFFCGLFGLPFPEEPVGTPSDPGFADTLLQYAPEDKNYMLSPLSISVAFAMLANGAQGETQRQILDVLGIENLNEYNTFIAYLTESYSKTDFLTLNLSDSIWLNTEYAGDVTFAKDFTDTLAEYYSAESGTVTYTDALSRINAWVAEKTQNRITEIIDDPEFLCCLLNAIYFRASWQNPFNKDSTAKDTFFSRDGSRPEIDFMNTVGTYGYYSDNRGTQVAELPYLSYDEDSKISSGLDISMYIILSEGRVYPEYLLDNISLTEAEVTLSIPKFETEYEVKLNGILQEMGMEDVFDVGKADIRACFNNLGNNTPYVSDAIHKTFISVDEKGTEAAAVTAILVKETASGSLQKVNFKADRPFTYVIRDNSNGEILFMGEYAFAE